MEIKFTKGEINLVNLLFKFGVTSIFISLILFFLNKVLDFYYNLQLRVNDMEYDTRVSILNDYGFNIFPIIFLVLGAVLVIISLWSFYKVR